MSDEELIARLRNYGHVGTVLEAADRIEELVKERDARPTWQQWKDVVAAGYEQKARAERLEAALREIAAEASVPVRTWKNGINFKKMYEGWRKIAVERIDIARAALPAVTVGVKPLVWEPITDKYCGYTMRAECSVTGRTYWAFDRDHMDQHELDRTDRILAALKGSDHE